MQDKVISVYLLTSIGISMLKLRRYHDRLIFNMGIPIPGKDGLYIEKGTFFLVSSVPPSVAMLLTMQDIFMTFVICQQLDSTETTEICGLALSMFELRPAKWWNHITKLIPAYLQQLTCKSSDIIYWYPMLMWVAMIWQDFIDWFID